MKNRLTQLLLLAGSSLFVISSATAATFVWTGAGADSNVLDAADNWTAAGVPASGSKLGTTNSADLITFDSETATAMPTSNIDLVRIGSGNQLPNFELLNGSLNFNRATNYQHGGTTFTIGDGDLTNSAVTNFNADIILNRNSSLLTYVINADGTLNIAQNFTWNSDSSKVAVVELNGGSVVSSGAVTAGLTNNASSVSFQSLDSSFTANFGGLFTDLTAVTDQFGDSFTATNSWTLAATDNLDGSFTVTAVPEPGALALSGLGVLLIVARRRRA